jgi:hypothetical protein
MKVTELLNLNLASNFIRCVDQQAFLGLAELERLDLSVNNLTYIHPNTFNYNNKLSWLSLADNKLFTLPSQEQFIYGRELAFLDLSNCSVAYISQQVFKDTQNIKYLNLSHNFIRNIEPGSFGPLKQLGCLDISFNSLSNLQVNIFSRNISIGDYISIDNLESCLVTESSSPVLKLKANNNPWRCDCDMKDLFEYISKQSTKFSGFTCKEPLKHENVSWTILGQENCISVNVLNVEVKTEIPTTVIPTSSVYSTEKPTTVIPTSSVYSTSAIVDVTEESAMNNHMSTPSQAVDTSLGIVWIFGIILIIMVLINGVLIAIIIRKCIRSNEQTRENTGALLRGEDREQRLQDSAL